MNRRYAVLASFAGTPDGDFPSAGVTLSGSALYGTTSSGGSSNWGTVFRMNTDGTGYTVLKNFTNGSDGAQAADLMLSGSVLYGTTFRGGVWGEGTVFKLDLSPLLTIQSFGNAVVLTWVDPSFALQAAPTANGVYSNIPGATSPYTDSLGGGQKFFRLLGN